MNNKVIITLTFLSLVFGILWIIMAYMNVKAQDGYLTPFTKCDYSDGSCKPIKTRNMFMSRAIRSINCPRLGWKNWGPKKVTAECKTDQRKGHATWITTILSITISLICLLFIYIGLSKSNVVSNFNMYFVYISLILVFGSLVGMLNVPFGNGPFKETHSSKTLHLILGIIIYLTMFSLTMYTSIKMIHGPKHGHGLILLYTSIIMAVFLIGSIISENIVDHGKKGQKAYDFYLKSQRNRNIIDSIFELGENIPIILFFVSVIFIGSSIVR